MDGTKTPLTLRAATCGDRRAIWAVLEPIFRAGDTYTIDADITRADALAFWVGGNHTAFVAEAGGKVVGTYYICANQNGGGAHVCNCGFATLPDARGMGVARRMLDHALKTARAKGFLAMQFNFVVATNTSAIRIWKEYGFAEIGRLPGAFRHPHDGFVDALVMYKRL